MEKLVHDYTDPRARAMRKWARLRRWGGNLFMRVSAGSCVGPGRALNGRRLEGRAEPRFRRWPDWYRRIVGAPMCVRHAGRPAVDVRRGVPMCGCCLHEFEGEPANAPACLSEAP